MSDRPHHRPALPGAGAFEAVEGGTDPAELRDAAERCALALVRGSSTGDDALVQRLVTLADSEGLDTLAALWAGSPPDSVAGALWRLYLLRSWVYAAPQVAAREYSAGRSLAPVIDVVAGVADPPGPDEVRAMVDEVLRGIARSDFSDVLFRAAAFARVVAAGRATLDEADRASDLSAARLTTMAEQLEQAARLDRDGLL